MTNLALTYMRFGQDSKAWLGWIHHQNTLRVGKQWQCGKTTHAFEARYDNSERAIGFMALPLVLAYGRQYQASDNTSVLMSLELEDDFAFAAKVQHRLNKHWTLGVNQVFDNRRKPANKRAPYDLGFDISYNL